MGKLFETTLRTIKKKDRAYKLTDGNGLYLYVSPTGKRVWRIDYAFEGKRKTHTIGEYPTYTLLDARQALAEHKIKLKQGIDPQSEKKAIASSKRGNEQNSFEAVAIEWYEVKSDAWRESYATKTMQLLKKNIFPFLGKMPLNEISAKNVWETLKRIEERGAKDTTIRAKGICSQIFCYGVATSRCEHDMTAGLKGVFKKPKRKSFATITDTKLIGKLMRDIDFYTKENKRTSPITQLALQLTIYTLCRSNEICRAEWAEFDFEKKLWTIPADKMKMSKAHIIPLSQQALNVLEELRPYSEYSPYLFPSERSKNGVIAGESLLKSLRIMGYDKETLTIHGLRAMASTLLNEEGYRPDIIEKALAHSDPNEIRGIYNRAEYIEERRTMMQEYADLLDKLKDSY